MRTYESVRIMIKIAFIHFNGLGMGGTERFLQTVAANLPKDEFQADYYYAGDAAEFRKKYLESHGVRLIRFRYQSRIGHRGYYYFAGCNLKEVYEGGYDLVQAGRYGSAESIFEEIRDTPIVDSIHYVGGADNQYNIARTMHISKFSRDMWVKMGGDRSRTVMISHPLEKPQFQSIDIRRSFGIDPEWTVYGFHQRDDDAIFSEVPLKAFKETESSKNAFLICGGSEKYRKQAKALGLKRCFFIEPTDNPNIIFSFLQAVDIYAHGRKDGELNSMALAEAMCFSLPIITHPSRQYNGHLEVMKGNGYVAASVSEYARRMSELEQDEELRKRCGNRSGEIFESRYDLNRQMHRIIHIYKEVLEEPYPDKLRRSYLGLRQRAKNKFLITAFHKYYV